MRKVRIIALGAAVVFGGMALTSPAMAAPNNEAEYSAVVKGKCPKLAEKLTITNPVRVKWKTSKGTVTTKSLKRGDTVCRHGAKFNGTWNLF